MLLLVRNLAHIIFIVTFMTFLSRYTVSFADIRPAPPHRVVLTQGLSWDPFELDGPTTKQVHICDRWQCGPLHSSSGASLCNDNKWCEKRQRKTSRAFYTRVFEAVVLWMRMTSRGLAVWVLGSQSVVIWKGWGCSHGTYKASFRLDMALLEKVCNQGWALRFQKTWAISSVPLCFLLADQSMSTQLFRPPCLQLGARLPCVTDSQFPETVSPIKCFLFVSCFGYDVLLQQ